MPIRKLRILVDRLEAIQKSDKITPRMQKHVAILTEKMPELALKACERFNKLVAELRERRLIASEKEEMDLFSETFKKAKRLIGRYSDPGDN